jgi:hypothetical protein
MSALERRYRRLLRAYPACYRKERGAEMLATLLEAAPVSETSPSLRDARVRPPRSWLWWLGAFPVWLLTGIPVLLPAIVLVLVLWIVVDARPAISLALLAAFFGIGQYSPAGLIFVAFGFMLALLAVVRLRRQAVL